MNSFPHTKPTGEIANHVYATKTLKTLIDRTNYFGFVAKIGVRVQALDARPKGDRNIASAQVNEN